jgi:molybdopterin synthase sulfur carrier subunit
VKLLYFAWVKQKIGRGEEDFPLPPGVTAVSGLIAVLRERGTGYAEAFAEPSRLKAARNQEHVGFDARIEDGDEIAFFPPVTGG